MPDREPFRMGQVGMRLALTFGESRSAKYPFAVKLAKTFDTYAVEDEDDDGASHSISIAQELREPEIFNKLLSLLNIVGTWKETTLTMNGKPVAADAVRRLSLVGECYHRQRRSGNPYHYCNGFDPRHRPTHFGCRLLAKVDRRLPNNGRQPASDRGWHTFGELDGYVFNVDKKKILTVLQEEAEERCVHACPVFSEEAVAEEVDLLPDRIDVRKDPNFVICNRPDGELGIRQKNIIERVDAATEGSGGTNGKGPRNGAGVDKAADEMPEAARERVRQTTREVESMGDVRHIPEISFDDVCGQDVAVAQVRDWVELPLRHPELFDHVGVPTHVGILLYGPPGTGKTLLAQAVAGESNAHLEMVNGPEILSKWVGQSEETMRGIFDRAKRLAPSVILLDEVDAIAPARDRVLHGHEVTLVSQLLTLMDGLYDRGQVIIIATSNRPDAVDPALRRPGRFDYSIHLGMPDKSGREAIFERHLAKMSVAESVELSELSERSDGYCGADIAKVCRQAGLICVKEAIEAGYGSVKSVVVEARHLKAALGDTGERSRRRAAP